MPPVLSVVVCTYNRSLLLADVLESLTRQTFDRAFFEVVVVDNNSTDNTKEIMESFCSRFQFFQGFREERQGLSYARNLGWQASLGEYVAFIDDDACAEADWCERIVDAFLSVKPPPASVGGVISPRYEATPPKWFDDVFELRTWGDNACFLSGEWGRFGFSGSNMAFPKVLLARYNGFRVDLGMIGELLRLGEEKDLFYRIHDELPYFWYDPKIKVRHWVPVGHMRVQYQLRRSFRSGRARATIQPCGKIGGFKNLGGSFKEFICSLWPSGRGYSADVVRKLCRVFHQAGVLFGPDKRS